MISIYLPYMPPSMNAAYENIPRRRVGKKVMGGGRRLTEAGKLFKIKVSQHVVKHLSYATKQIKPNSAIGLYVAFGLPGMFNKGYPEKTDARYKKVDSSNRVKILEDALTECINFDDSQIVFSIVTKYPSKEEETRLWLWNEDEEVIGGRLSNAFDGIAGLIP